VPLHQTILLFVVALMAAGIAALFRKRLKADLLRPRFWLTLACAAGGVSAVSILVSASRSAGTGTTTSYGWPKSFYFRYLSETAERTDGFSLIYFAGSVLALAGALLIGWTVWRFLRS
jgi:hypothetical protein